jgi:hypothetical protein
MGARPSSLLLPSEKKSWFGLVITGFGALLVR